MSKKNRFITPGTVRLELSEGDWIEIKQRLSYGEQQKLASDALGKKVGLLEGQPQVELDMATYQIKRLRMWIVDWSFTDDRDRHVPVSEDAIANLDPDAAEEIDAAITAYLEAREAEKKGMVLGGMSPSGS